MFSTTRSCVQVLGSGALLCMQPVYAAPLRTAPKVDPLIALNLHPDPDFINNGTDWIFLNTNHSFETLPRMGRALKHSGIGSFQDSHVADLNVLAGETININFLAMRPTATTWWGNGFGIHLQYKDANGATIQYIEQYVTQADLPADIPTLMKFSHIVPAGAVSARLVHSIRETFPNGAIGYTARPRVVRDRQGRR